MRALWRAAWSWPALPPLEGRPGLHVAAVVHLLESFAA
jgi:hypothetical protein